MMRIIYNIFNHNFIFHKFFPEFSLAYPTDFVSAFAFFHSSDSASAAHLLWRCGLPWELGQLTIGNVLSKINYISATDSSSPSSSQLSIAPLLEMIHHGFLSFFMLAFDLAWIYMGIVHANSCSVSSHMQYPSSYSSLLSSLLQWSLCLWGCVIYNRSI